MIEKVIAWARARWAEGGTQQGLSSLMILAVVGAMFYGLDIGAALGAAADKLTQVALALGAVVNLRRVLMPDPRGAVPDAAADILAEMRSAADRLKEAQAALEPLRGMASVPSDWKAVSLPADWTPEDTARFKASVNESLRGGLLK